MAISIPLNLKRGRFGRVLVGLIAVACLVKSPLRNPSSEPLFPGLGAHSWKIPTKYPLAQRYFDQGVAFMNGFNHEEAIRSFSYAVQLDPTLAIAHWGVAIANGPNINDGMRPERVKPAWDALQMAKALAGKSDQLSRDLIEAASARYPSPESGSREKADQAYAAAMRVVWRKHPDNPDVGALFAESLMDLHPWDQWTEAGIPKADTEEVLATLQQVLRLDPNHPQGIHLYIHATEASAHPDLALSVAGKLDALQPGLGHMVHMPSHTYVRTGRWHEAISCNARAIAADAAYQRRSPVQHGYRGYMGHNYDMLKFAAMMCGRKSEALRHSREAARIFSQVPDLAGGAMVAGPLEVLKRFGDWDAILREPEFPKTNTLAAILRHGARAIAFAATQRPTDARREQEALETRAQDFKGGADTTDGKILTAERHLVAGELAFADGHVNESVQELGKAVEAEDSIGYDEPPVWSVPTRHALGAVLNSAGRYQEAVEVYSADLKRWPLNGWSLFGRSQALAKLGRTAESRRDAAAFRKVWAGADTPMTTSCLCVKPR